MSAFLFAYGTLQPGRAPAEIASVVALLRPIGEGFVNGVLNDLDGYTGAVLDPSAHTKIHGTVLQLPADRELLSDLDAYEEFDPAAPHTSLFIRILHPVTLETGGSVQCWIYICNRNPGSRPLSIS